ncbi:MAG: hypothetical protein AAF390_07525 [Pseudomonadota bacterium]
MPVIDPTADHLTMVDDGLVAPGDGDDFARREVAEMESDGMEKNDALAASVHRARPLPRVFDDAYRTSTATLGASRETDAF